MDIASYGWVSNPDDVVSWENGLKWLSKAIVSDNDQQDKLELKSQLDAHLEAAFRHAETQIREASIFYCLAWKKFDLLELFLKESNSRQTNPMLVSCLARIFSNYELTAVDFERFVLRDRQQTMDVLRDLLVNKQLHPLVRTGYLEELHSRNEQRMAQAVRALAEIHFRMGVDGAFLKQPLQRMIQGYLSRFDQAMDSGDFAWCIAFLDMVDPLRSFIDGDAWGLADRFRRLLFQSPPSLREDAFSHMLRWRQGKILKDFCTQGCDGNLPHLMTVALHGYFEKADFSRPDAERLVQFVSGKDSAVICELVDLVLDHEAEVPRMQEQFRRALHGDERTAVLNAFYLGTKLDNLLGIKHHGLSRLRQEFLNSLWQETVVSHDHNVWRRTFGLLLEMEWICFDTFIEEEFLLPLLREGLFSFSSLVTKEVILLSREYEVLQTLVRQWAANGANQRDLSEGLFEPNLKQQIRHLNRLVSIYYRVNIKSTYLTKRVREFWDMVQGQSMLPDLKHKIQVAVQGLCGRLE